MRLTFTLVAVVALLSTSLQVAHASIITFDTDAAGNPFTAPAGFADTVPLEEQYAALGVHFSSPYRSGRIIGGGGWSSVPDPHSGPNDVRFNELLPSYKAPMTISFDSLMSEVSLYAGAGGHSFTLTAFDATNTQVDQFTGVLSGSEWVRLDVASTLGIKKVVFDANVNLVFYAFDDLSFTSIPEPSTLAIWSLLGLCGFGLYRRRKR